MFNKKNKKIEYLLLVIFFFFLSLFLYTNKSEALISSSDRISLSGPGVKANHTITFKLSKNIPASGKIVISPENGFFVESGFDYSDVDFGISSNINGPFTERDLATTSSALSDGVEVVASTTSGSITINLNSSAGISAGTYLRVLLGTNAVYGEIGDKQIINPSAVNDYNISIYTYNNFNVFIERSNVKVYIIEPVTMGVKTPKSRSNGSPIGYLVYGTTQTIMSLYTNFPARCRYSTASGTPYASMTDDFSYSTASSSFYHSVVIDGLQNGHTYDYYVRCIDDDGISDDETGCFYSNASTTPYTTASGTPILELQCTDYYIRFFISSIEGGVGDESGVGGDGDNDNEDNGGSSDGSSSSSGGGSGSGSGGGSGAPGNGPGTGKYLPYPPLPGEPGVILEGYAFPNRDVVILKDGVEVGRALGGSNADFGGFLSDLTRGVYTFSLWSDDVNGLKSNTFSTTFWIDNGTQTTVSDIILSPTISIVNNSVSVGDTLEVHGYSVPNAKIEAWMYLESDGDSDDEKITKNEGVISASGAWSLYINTDSLNNGTYLLKARVIMDVGVSPFSKSLKVSLGEGVVSDEGECSGADLNHDKKVNLTDFSILLYHWGTNNACADQNHDGNVDLTDFSIMMYYWTG